MNISVIILTFNSEKYLPDLLESLKQTQWPEGKHEVVFVDNGSEDATVSLLNKFKIQNSRFKIILNNINLGFTGGNNIGIRHALDSGADSVVLLNHDTVVTPEWIQELVYVYEKQPDAGAVQSLLLHEDKRDVINSWGNEVHYLGFGLAGGNLEKLQITNYKLQKNREVVYASGAAVMYRGDVLREVGVFDETLYHYHEDLDLGLRMRLRGYHSYIAPQSVVYHKYSFPLRPGKQGRQMFYLQERNRLYTMLKLYSVKTLILIFPMWLMMELGMQVFALMRGFWSAKMRTYGWVIANMKTIRKKRKEVQSTRTVSDTVLMKDFVSEIHFQEIKNPLLTGIANPVMRGWWRLIKRVIS